MYLCTKYMFLFLFHLQTSWTLQVNQEYLMTEPKDITKVISHIPSSLQYFLVVTIFQTHQFLQLSSINFLTLLNYKESSQQLGFTLKLSPEDLTQFCTLQKADKQLQSALKHSQKWGGNSDGEDQQSLVTILKMYDWSILFE